MWQRKEISAAVPEILHWTICVQEAAITTASGDVELSLPEKGAKIKYTTTGGDLETDLDHKKPETSMYLVMEKPI